MTNVDTTMVGSRVQCDCPCPNRPTTSFYPTDLVGDGARPAVAAMTAGEGLTPGCQAFLLIAPVSCRSDVVEGWASGLSEASRS
jgi:hypothetical protein